MTTTSSVFLPARKPKPVVTKGVLHKLMARQDARLAASVSLGIVLIAVFGPLFTQDPDLVDYTNQLAAPSLNHLFGTDGAGRDLLARSVYGARTSLGAAALVTIIISVVGLLVGVIAGCVGGIFDTIASRIIDILLGLPGLIVTLAIVGMLGPGFLNLILAMSATAWAVVARLARAVALGAMHHPDILAARMAGASRVRVALEHILPSATAQVAVVAMLGISEVVLSLAALSFLGLGAQPPTAEWGTMLASARQTLAFAPWQLIGPALGIVATVLCATLLSEALRDVTDPGGAP